MDVDTNGFVNINNNSNIQNDNSDDNKYKKIPQNLCKIT